ncbi:MAG: DEAD/DEAH box helicase [Deltaproteobacteria bacterium]|nr:DEAD/DEAH box helicase [Deltaproteobacteria bacterium]
MRKGPVPAPEGPEGPRRRPPARTRGQETPYGRAVERAREALGRQGRTPSAIQEACFAALSRPENALVVAPTGSGKTAAVLLPLLASRAETEPSPGVGLLYIAPVRALVSTHTAVLEGLVRDLGLALRVRSRSGDTSSSERARQVRSPPEVLVTTPESLGVLLGGAGSRILEGVREVVLDEVHLLASGKRGALLAATLEVLDALQRAQGAPPPRRLALSATAEPVEAMAAWVGPGTRVVAVGGQSPPRVSLGSVALEEPYPPARWTWRTALPRVARRLAEADGLVLLFVGSRARAEQWALALRDVLPPRVPVACYHGSLGAEERAEIARRALAGELRAVVSTSALEAGVDLPAVREVLLLGAPGSVTRAVQAAGRAEHRPGSTPRATVLPVDAWDTVRAAAVVEALAAGEREPVELRARDLDVAIQAALGRVALGPCTREELSRTLRRSWPFQGLTERDLDAVLGFLSTGGDAFRAYPELARVVTDGERYALASERARRRYVQHVGTISGDAMVPVRAGDVVVGQLEGRYAALLSPGDRFVLGGRTWRVTDATGAELRVRRDRDDARAVPRWTGGRGAFSETVAARAEALWGRLESARSPEDVSATLGCAVGEGRAVWALVEAQRRVARLPSGARSTVELVREGSATHLVAYAFGGAMAHEVLARAVAWRLREKTGLGAEVSAQDELLCVSVEGAPRLDERAVRALFSPAGLREDFLAAAGEGVLAGAYFREVARVSQLWSPERQRPGTVSPALLYDVLRKHDPGHCLLRALDHTLWTALEGPRAERVLEALAARPWALSRLRGPSPLAIPVFAWGARDTVSPEDPETALAAAAHALFQRAAGP